MAQSTILGDTGNGSTISFASGITAALKVRSIDPSPMSVGYIDVSDLESEGIAPVIAEDLSRAQTLQLEVIWDTFFAMPTAGLALGDVTVTLPQRSGESTPATWVASGHVQSVKPPRLETNVLQVLSLTIQLEEAIAYTKST